MKVSIDSEVKNVQNMKTEFMNDRLEFTKTIKEKLDVELKAKFDILTKIEKERSEFASKQSEELREQMETFRNDVAVLLARKKEEQVIQMRASSKDASKEETMREEFLLKLKGVEDDLISKSAALVEKNRKDNDKVLEKLKEMSSQYLSEKEATDKAIREAEASSRENFMESIRHERSDAHSNFMMQLEGIENRASSNVDGALKKINAFKDDTIKELKDMIESFEASQKEEEENREKRVKLEKKEREERNEKDRKVLTDLISDFKTEKDADMTSLLEIKESLTQERTLSNRKAVESEKEKETIWNNRMSELEKDRIASLKVEKDALRDIITNFQKEITANHKLVENSKEDFAKYLSDAMKNDAALRNNEKASFKKQIQSEIDEIVENAEKQHALRMERLEVEKSERERVIASLNSMKRQFDNERSEFREELAELKSQNELEDLKRKANDVAETNKRLAIQKQELQSIMDNFTKEKTLALEQMNVVKETLLKEKESFKREHEARRMAELAAIENEKKLNLESFKEKKATQEKLKEELTDYTRQAIQKESESLKIMRDELQMIADESDRKLKESIKTSQAKLQSTLETLKISDERREKAKHLEDIEFNAKYNSMNSEFMTLKMNMESELLKYKNEDKDEFQNYVVDQQFKMEEIRLEMKDLINNLMSEEGGIDPRTNEKLTSALTDISILKDNARVSNFFLF